MSLNLLLGVSRSFVPQFCACQTQRRAPERGTKKGPEQLGKATAVAIMVGMAATAAGPSHSSGTLHPPSIVNGFDAPLPVYSFHADSKEARSLYVGCHRSITEQEIAALEVSLGIRAPDWIMLGAQKAGTTSFERSIRDIACIRIGEVHFFDDVRFMSRQVNTSDVRNYMSEWGHCRDSPMALPHFEKSPGYASQAWAAQRMCETLGSRAKLTMLLREPVSRAYSSFYQAPDPDFPLPLTPDGFHTEALLEMQLVGECGGLYDGDVRVDTKRESSFAACCARVARSHGIMSEWKGCGSIEDATPDLPTWDRATAAHNGGSYGDKRYAHVRNSIYITQLRAYLRFHRSTDVLLVEDGDLYPHFSAVAKELALAAAPPLTPARYHLTERVSVVESVAYTAHYPPIRNDTAAMLNAFYRQYNERFFELIGRTLPW